jgi:hypothetical protein
MSRDDLFAAVQAQLIYIIMRVNDNSKLEQDLNLELLSNYEVCSLNFNTAHRLNQGSNYA